MQYICYECDKEGIRIELSTDIDERFISYEGKCLCSKCSKGVKPISKHELDIIKRYKD